MYKRLLVAVDGSEQSYKALDHAVAIAEKFGSELVLLTVARVPTFLGDESFDRARRVVDSGKTPVLILR